LAKTEAKEVCFKVRIVGTCNTYARQEVPILKLPTLKLTKCSENIKMEI